MRIILYTDSPVLDMSCVAYSLFTVCICNLLMKVEMFLHFKIFSKNDHIIFNLSASK